MKAILIIDMPKSCLDCCLTDNEYGDCVAVNFIKRGNYENRPEWCPLKPLPKREPEHFTSNREEVHDVYFQGWNACLDEIMGGENDR